MKKVLILALVALLTAMLAFPIVAAAASESGAPAEAGEETVVIEDEETPLAPLPESASAGPDGWMIAVIVLAALMLLLGAFGFVIVVGGGRLDEKD